MALLVAGAVFFVPFDWAAGPALSFFFGLAVFLVGIRLKDVRLGWAGGATAVVALAVNSGGWGDGAQSLLLIIAAVSLAAAAVQSGKAPG
jgi:anaerobic C4-dicarboxylate transporter